MNAASTRLLAWVEAARRELADAELAWLRHMRVDDAWQHPARRVLGPEADEQLSELLHRNEWSAEQQRGFREQRAWLGFQLELAALAPARAALALDPIELPAGSETPGLLLAGLVNPAPEERELRSRALDRRLEGFVARLIEVRGAAERVRATGWPADAQEGRDTALKSLARELLSKTDDAARDMVRWATRGHSPTGTVPWHALLRALRAPELDGLAKPARRFARLAQGLRGLGFERDMNARLRMDRGVPLLSPRVRLVCRAVPGDVRLAQSPFHLGILSDVFAARGIGEGLGLVLASPALDAFARWPLEPGVAAALGVLYMQLRAERTYLGRVEGFEELMIERAARHAGLIVLLELRLQAALYLGARAPVREEGERASQLQAALARALDVELPASVAALAWFDAPAAGSALAATATGLAVHAGLRERYDTDWYRNPRVADVMRGAAARGQALALSGLCEELGVTAGSASARALELLG